MTGTASDRVDVSLILTAHREGLLAGVSSRSLMKAWDQAREAGLTCELLVVLDNADALTRDTLLGVFEGSARVFETTFGDPGPVRNHGICQAQGRYSAFLDGDDLWSRNWISAAVEAARARPEVIFQSACNVFFGDANGLWWHADSESALFDPGYLRWMNYWDAMTFAETDLYKRFPFRANDLRQGFGHEDWHWNIVTYGAGIPHKPVPDTLHFKRRRGGTQSTKVDDVRGVPFHEPNAVLDRSVFEALLEQARNS